MSMQTEKSDSNPEEDKTDIIIHEPFNLIKEYIPCPELTVNSCIEDLMKEMKTQIQNLDSFDGPPYFSQTFGKMRKEAYIKFNDIIKHYSGNKRNQYKRLFYKDIDLKFEQYLNQESPFKEKYRDEITKGKVMSSPKKIEDLYHLEDSGK